MKKKITEIRLDHLQKFYSQNGNNLNNAEIYFKTVHLHDQLQIITNYIDTLQKDDAT